jgi:hypothetical protein
MELTTVLERIYAAVPSWLVAAALGPAALSLLIRLVGLRRNYLVSRPRALVGLTAVITMMALFYASLHVSGAPISVAARGGVVRVLLICLGVAVLHWNIDYLKWAVGRAEKL